MVFLGGAHSAISKCRGLFPPQLLYWSTIDYLGTIKLAAVKYAAKENGAIYDKFFSSIGSFEKN